MDANSWSDLNPDILNCIIHKLDIVDFFHFLSTCRSWHSSAQIHMNCCPVCPKAQTPWLLFSSHYDLKSRKFKPHLSFYDIASTKFYEIPVIGIISDIIGVIGSSNGFLIVVDSAYNIHIINPMTSAHYPLPRSCSTIIDHFKYSPHLTNLRVAIDICLTTNLTYSVALSLDSVIMYVNSNYASWIELTHTGIYNNEDGDNFDEDVDDIIFYKGKLHIMCESGSYVFDFENYFEMPTNLHFDRLGHPWNYLVKSPNDNYLFLVIRKAEYVGNGERIRWITKGFEVYKFDDIQVRWDKVKDLGEFALFVGPNTFFFLPTSTCSSIVTRNDICFVDEMNGDGVGVLDFVGGSIQRFDLHYGRKWNPYLKAFWFTPTLV